MKRVEITSTAIMNELAKLNTQLEKAQNTLSKKQATAEKLGVLNMTNDEHREWMQSCEKTADGMFLANKEDIKKNGAWFDVIRAENRVEELVGKIENAEGRFAKAEQAVEEYREEVARMEDAKAKEELRKLGFEQEQAEWAKDGIKLESRYAGTTPNGKRFWIVGNSGYTERSLHCFTLTIGGETVFTSGEFWRAYAVVKNN